ncbi:MAG: DUF3820 family protein [Simkaniaceae bacterium]|nr:DUF3820 family protein [Simkaniaceae bacterium]
MAKRPIYYDTETTGVKAERDRIIEIAAFDPVQNKTFCQFVNPGMPIPPASTAIHNITDDMVESAPTFKEVGLEFTEFCSGDVVLIAHNNDAFDKHFLEHEYKRSEIEKPDWIYIDSLKWARKYRPDLPRHSLQHLREMFGIDANNAHRALDDVMILYKVFQNLIDDLSMETIIELLSKKTVLRHMPFGKHKGKPLCDVPKNYVSWLLDNGALDKAENKELKESFIKHNLLTS